MPPPGGPRQVLLSGATGLIGRALTPLLESHGWQVTRLTRRPRGDGRPELTWDPTLPDGGLQPRQVAPFEAVIHLAGENIAAGRWSAARKAEIRRSRVQPTAALARLIAAQGAAGPRHFLCASAVGYYGDQGDAPQDESAAPGSGYLAQVCGEWEAAAEPARLAGVRTAHLRIGVVLSRQGGALAAMLPAFRLGLGGPLGSGRQFMSWVALEDVAGAFAHVLERPELTGAFNLTAPSPLRQAEFARTLGRVLHRPALLPAPAAVLRLTLGEMAEALLLASLRILPTRLGQAGYVFRQPELEPALRAALAP